MRKCLALSLALLLLAAALAETDAFTFRNSICWGMTQEEVLAAEGDPDTETDREDGLDILRIPEAIHEEAPCRLEYLFFNGALVMARADYDMDSADATLEGLKDRLSSRYGEATTLTTEQLGELTLDENPADSFYGWVLDSETLVCLTEHRSEQTIRILYSQIIETDA